MNIRSVTLAGIATLMLALPAAAAVDTSGISGTAPAKAVRAQFAAVVCMTDEGNGRMRPCNALYKQQHPNWRAGDESENIRKIISVPHSVEAALYGRPSQAVALFTTQRRWSELNRRWRICNPLP